MMNLLLKLVIYIPLIFSSVKGKGIQSYLISSDSIQIINQGEVGLCNDCKIFNQMMGMVLSSSHQMPAFGVSIHQETINQLEHGLWLRLKYNRTQIVDDMMFDELLIKLEKDIKGFNIIRGNRGIYEGRCYYVDLADNTVNELLEYILQY